MITDSPSLRILMVAPQPFFRARGTPFSVLHRIRALCSAGHTVDLITYPFGEDVEIPGLTILRAARPPGVKDVKIGPSFAKILLDIPVWRLTKKRLSEHKYDVLHSHEEAAFFCVGLAKKFGLPHIYDMHSSLPQQLKTFGSFDIAPIRGVFEYNENRVLRSCDGVISICDDLAVTALKECGDTPHAMIENTADDRNAFPESSENIRDEFGLHNKQIVLYTGTFESYQGLDLLFAAFERVARELPDAHLLMVGGRPVQIEAFQKLAAELGITERVTFTGMVSPKRIPAFHDASDLIVSPRSSGTNSPLKIYGYMRTEKPIVATNLYTHTQVLGDGMAELVDPTPEAFAAGILRVLNDNEHATALARAAKQKADAEFSDQQYIDKVLDFYSAVMSRVNAKRDALAPPSDSTARAKS